MSGTTRSSEGLDPRRRKALFRSWHRGTREMDLMLGRFADAQIDRLTDAELSEYEQLIEAAEDPEMFAWLNGEKPTPAAYDTPLLARIRTFHEENPQ